MSSISSITPASSAPNKPMGQSLNDMNMDDFLKLMITQLQNQDPLEPMENSELLQQLSQIRDISATDHLTDTLDAVQLGQTLSTASAMIGKEVSALSDDGKNINGLVDRVSVQPIGDGTMRDVRVHLGEYSVALENVREILPAASE